MAAYLVAYVEQVVNQAGLQEYAAGAAALMARFGGRYLFASFGPEALEGDEAPQAVAVAEFPDAAAVRAFWEAPEYEPLRQLRHRSARVRLLLAEAAPMGG